MYIVLWIFVYSNKDLAEIRLKEFDPEGIYRDEYRIEIFYVDQKNEDCIERDFFRCEIDLKTGDIIEQTVSKDQANINERGRYCYIQDSAYFGRDPYITASSYVSSDHALKLAIELRQNYLRMQLYGIKPQEMFNEIELESL